MEHIILLVLVGVVGWSLLIMLIVYNSRCRRTELEMIEDITKELRKIKDDINKLK